MRRWSNAGGSWVFILFLGVPLILGIYALGRFWWWIAAIIIGSLMVGMLTPILHALNDRLDRDFEKKMKALREEDLALEAELRGLGVEPEKNARAEKAIGQRAMSCVAESASDTSKEAHMTHDTRLALIDSDGEARFPAIINGTFQIGKDRRRTPTCIEAFSRAILIEGEDGRFVCADGRKPGILKFSGRAKEARAYRLDPTLAAKLGIPSQGTR